MCTTVIVGKKASRTGSTIIARNADCEEPIQPVRYVNVAENENGKGEYKSNVTGFTEEFPSKSLQYQMIPFIEYEKPTLGVMGEAGINSLNVAMSSTESIFGNVNVLSIDPLTEKGFGEDSLLSMVLPYIKSAKDGVYYVGEIIKKYGSHEGNGIIFSDADEIWYMEIPCGHHWVAQRIPDDHAAVIANQSIIEEIDFSDKTNFLYSEGLREFVEKNNLNPDKNGFNFRHIFGTSSKEDRVYNTPRVWYGQKLFGYEDSCPAASDMPFTFKPNRLLDKNDVAQVLSSHYDETPYDPFDENEPIKSKKFRPISMNRTAESHILEIRNNVPKEIAAIFWLCIGPTAFNAYVPFYTNSNDTPDSYKNTSIEYSPDQAYWMYRTVDVLVERDYDALKSVSFDYISNSEVLTNQLVQKTDSAYLEGNPKDSSAFLTQKNDENIKALNELLQTHIGDLIARGLALSKLTFNITKDV